MVAIPGLMHLKKCLLSAIAAFDLAMFGPEALHAHGWMSPIAFRVFFDAGKLRKTEATVITIAEAGMEATAYSILMKSADFPDKCCEHCRPALEIVRQVGATTTASARQTMEDIMRSVRGENKAVPAGGMCIFLFS